MKEIKTKRDDLQILRAFSVLLVLVYHLNIGILEGGFVGVDIFFVISGFFVAQMLSGKQLKLTDVLFFLHRRIARLAPNLVFYIFLTLPFVIYFYPPHLIKDFGQSIVSNSVFMSNIFFYYETDYYNDFSRTAPLLHTWSLGVEVQYYFVFAILMYILPNNMRIMYSAIVFISALSLFAGTNYISVDKTAVFYLLNFRFWELAAGYLAFYISKKYVIKSNRIFLTFVLYTILLLIGLLYSDSTVFPALSAAPVVFCTFLLLLIKWESCSAGMLRKFLIAIGNRSYSIYLSHNIFVTVLTTAFVQLPSVAYLAIIFFGSALTTEISYRLVEQKLYYRSFNVKKFYPLMVMFTLVIAVIGFHLHTTNGLRALKLDKATTSKYFLDYDKLRTNRGRFVSENLAESTQSFGDIENQILILGDSKSEDLFILMNSINRDNTQYRRLRLDDNCMQSPNNFIFNKLCQKEIENVIKSNLLENASHVVLTATWQRQNISGILNFVSYLENLGKSVAVVSTANFQDVSSVALQLKNIPEQDFDSIFYQSIRDDWRRQYLELQKELQKSTSVKFFEKLDLFCSMGSKKCNLLSPNLDWLIYDTGHLTIRGFLELSKNIEAQEWGVFND